MKTARIVVYYDGFYTPHLKVKGISVWNLTNNYMQSDVHSANQPTPTIAQFLRNTSNALINNRLELYSSGILKEALS
jgi:hypothetical protein